LCEKLCESLRGKKNVSMLNASESHAHSPARAEVERVGPLEGSRSGGGACVGRTADAAVGRGGVAMMCGVSLDKAIRAGSMSTGLKWDVLELEYVFMKKRYRLLMG
jgi:hypothetical protein